MKFHVPDMSCGHCAAAIDQAVKALDPAATVETDLAAKLVTVRSSQAADAVRSALDKAGYPARPV